MEQIKETRKKYEFLTFLILKEEQPGWRCGVVQNVNNRFITFYDMARIRNPKSQERFLAYADKWWWESGMALPIDAYIGEAFDEFQYSLSSIPRKTLTEDPIGPVYSLANQYLKRIKKRRIDLVNRKRITA